MIYLVIKRGWFTLIVLLGAGFFFNSCKDVQKPVEKIEKISLGISKSFLSIPIYIAKHQGFFAAEGLDITVNEYGSGKLATEAMLKGEVDISTAADMPIVFNSFKEQDFCILSTFTSSYSFVKVIARKDRGIRKASDLKGKKIGANQGTSSHFYLGALLAYNHILFSDIEVIYKKTGELPDTLINGDVDAISVWAPHTQKALNALGDNAITLKSPEIFRVTFNLASKKNFIQKRPLALKKILRALEKAALYIQSKKEKAASSLSKIFNVNLDEIRKVIENYNFGIFLDQALLVGLDDIARWAIENKFVEKKQNPNFLEYICTDILDMVNPAAVTIIR